MANTLSNTPSIITQMRNNPNPENQVELDKKLNFLERIGGVINNEIWKAGIPSDCPELYSNEYYSRGGPVNDAEESFGDGKSIRYSKVYTELKNLETSLEPFVPANLKPGLLSHIQALRSKLTSSL